MSRSIEVNEADARNLAQYFERAHEVELELWVIHSLLSHHKPEDGADAETVMKWIGDHVYKLAERVAPGNSPSHIVWGLKKRIREAFPKPEKNSEKG